LAFSLNVCSKYLDTLHQSLLAQAFSGELAATWREAHAAELTHAAEERDRLLHKAQHISGAYIGWTSHTNLLSVVQSSAHLVLEAELASAAVNDCISEGKLVSIIP
jgi:hypothetical protein